MGHNLEGKILGGEGGGAHALGAPATYAYDYMRMSTAHTLYSIAYIRIRRRLVQTVSSMYII